MIPHRAHAGNSSIWAVKLALGSTLIVQDLVFANGVFDGGNGGALNVVAGANATLSLFECQFANNVAKSGGAIWMESNGSLVLNACDFLRNTATLDVCSALRC